MQHLVFMASHGSEYANMWEDDETGDTRWDCPCGAAPDGMPIPPFEDFGVPVEDTRAPAEKSEKTASADTDNLR